MKKDDYTGIIILCAIIGIALMGGAKNGQQYGFFSPQPKTEEQKRIELEQKIRDTQQQVEELKKKVQTEEDKKTQSEYKGIVYLQYVNRSDDPKQEYISIRVNTGTSTIPVTGWTIKSDSSGNSVTIPKGTYLFFTGMLNAEDNVVLQGGDTLYVNTGISPNGSSFKVNKCSGYLSQFQTFTPSLYTNCPAPRNEDLSSIPKRVINDDCFDYIDSFPTCRIQTESLSQKWSYECTRFIYDKINYASCVNTHKNDTDFYQKEWRIYLKRSERLWKDRKEKIILYDNSGKIVDTLTY